MRSYSINPTLLLDLPAGAPPLPPGWLSNYEARILYTLAAGMPDQSRILEIGSWVGRSSCCIAYGIRDSARRSIRYDIVDFGIAGIDEWEARFGSNLFHLQDARKIAEVVMFPGGTAGLLKKNLVDRGLSSIVTSIFLGDLENLESKGQYNFVFCDAVHDLNEIEKNIPIIKSLIDEKNFVLACDDVISHEVAIKISSMIDSKYYFISHEMDNYSKLAVFGNEIILS